MYRGGRPRQGSSSSSSDEDYSSTSKFACIRLDDETNKRKKLNLWSDVLQEREITEGVSVRMGIDGDEEKVDRGSESYLIPEDRLAAQSGEDSRISTLQRPVKQYENAIFGDVAVEKGDPRYADGGSTTDSKSRGRKWKGKNNGSRSGSKQRNHKDSDGRCYIRQGGSRASSQEKVSRKRVWRSKKIVPKALLAQDFSPEAMNDISIPRGLPIDELAERLAKALGEKELTYVMTAVNAVGEEWALKIFERTREIEAVGGMLTMNQSRRRTPGGVFMTLFKADPDVPQPAKDVIGEMQRNKSRETKQAKRRVERSKDKVEEKSLPTAADLFLAQCSTAKLGKVSGTDMGTGTKRNEDDMEEGELSS